MKNKLEPHKLPSNYYQLKHDPKINVNNYGEQLIPKIFPLDP